MESVTIVLPSARAIRQEQLSLEEKTLFLPNYITMAEFISKLVVVDGYKFIDDDTRTLLLLEASDFEAFSQLQITRNFFTFTKNSSYIFKFFSELSAELYNIEALQNADIYGEYEEHITILIELYKRYEKLCNERKYLDKIFLPSLYKFNASYAQEQKKILLRVDGYLTNFEFELLQEATKYSEVEILFSTSKFNVKMQSKFTALGLELESGFEYRISLNTESIIEKIPLHKSRNIVCESFTESLLQVAFVKRKIYEFVKKGYLPEKIAVVLPNESFAPILKSFDVKSNLNFAMGDSFRVSEIFQTLDATMKAIDLDSKENEARLERVGDVLYFKLFPIYKRKNAVDLFMEFLVESSTLFTNKRELSIYSEEIEKFKKIALLMQEMSVKSLMNLFMQRLAARSLDDVRGGKITVLGVLETRSVEFDAVIIVDFDDKNVPKRSDKDMFLNTQLREMAGLPTMSDRENLQKHYYEMLMNASKEVAISYVSSQESNASRFLKELGIQTQNQYSELEYSNILFHTEKKERTVFHDKTIPYSFKDVKLSSTRLKTFLSCKRKYYYKYVEHLNRHEIPQDMLKEYEIGQSVHSALKELYSKQSSYSDIEALERDLNRELDKETGENELERYLIALQKKRLKPFAHNEIAHFSEGWSVASTEEFIERAFKGITLVGQIDRVDIRDKEVFVLDYKTGSYKLYNKNNFTQAEDFQLEFYYLLAKKYGDDVSCGFYDLKESRIVFETFLEEKLGLLESHIKDLLSLESIETTQCEDQKECLFCEYALLCDRA